MKKLMISFLIMLFSVVLTGCKDNKYKKITVAEVTHSVFYAPQYVAISKGFFKEEGLEIELINAGGADKVMAALLSKDVDVGFSGPEATIYVYNNGEENYMVNFAQLTKRDGSFIVGRTKNEDFQLTDLKGKSILGGRAGGMPLMNLEYVLKEAGLSVGRDTEGYDVMVRTDIQFNAMAGAFVQGEADYTTLFEPTALMLEQDGSGYVLTSVGKYSPEVPFTSYYVTKEYLKENKEIVQKFTNAIYKAQKYVMESTNLEVAIAIKDFFPDTSVEDLAEVIKRYREADVWCDTPYFKEEGLNRLMDIMTEAKELEKRAKFTDIVDNSFAENAVK